MEKRYSRTKSIQNEGFIQLSYYRTGNECVETVVHLGLTFRAAWEREGVYNAHE